MAQLTKNGSDCLPDYRLAADGHCLTMQPQAQYLIAYPLTAVA